MQQHADDTSVYITGDGFDACGESLDCVAGLMAHEATHSWIEGMIEQTSLTNNPRLSEYTVAEEMYADLVAMQMGDPNGKFQKHYFDKGAACKQHFGGDCDPQTMLEFYYQIDLSDVPSRVYGK